MPKTYRLIIDPTVQAEQVTPETIDWIADWCKGRIARELDPESKIERITGVNVVTQNGVKLAAWGYYVVKKLNGDFKVYDPKYFTSKYALMVACRACSMQRCDEAMNIQGCICCAKRHKS